MSHELVAEIVYLLKVVCYLDDCYLVATAGDSGDFVEVDLGAVDKGDDPAAVEVSPYTAVVRACWRV